MLLCYMRHELKGAILKKIFYTKENQFYLECETPNFFQNEVIRIFSTPYFILKILNTILDKTRSNEIKNIIDTIKKANEFIDFYYDFKEINDVVKVPEEILIIISKEEQGNKSGQKGRILNTNEFLLRNISNTNPIRIKRQAVQEIAIAKDERLDELFSLLLDSYRLHRTFIDRGFSEEFARKNTGLESDLLFEIAKLKTE